MKEALFFSEAVIPAFTADWQRLYLITRPEFRSVNRRSDSEVKSLRLKGQGWRHISLPLNHSAFAGVQHFNVRVSEAPVDAEFALEWRRPLRSRRLNTQKEDALSLVGRGQKALPAITQLVVDIRHVCYRDVWDSYPTENFRIRCNKMKPRKLWKIIQQTLNHLKYT